jgi:hypothetical protein
MTRLLVVLILIVSFDAAAQSASPINPSRRPLGSSDYDRIPTYRSPDYAGIYDSISTVVRPTSTIESRASTPIARASPTMRMTCRRRGWL